MKNIFTNEEIQLFINKVGNKGKVRVNKCGNLEIKFNNTSEIEWFVLYFTKNNKYLWRRHAYTYYGKYEYPLNMKRDKPQKIKNSYYKCGYYMYYPYSVENSEFNNVNEAFNYFFNNYLVNFPLTKNGLIRY